MNKLRELVEDPLLALAKNEISSEETIKQQALQIAGMDARLNKLLASLNATKK